MLLSNLLFPSNFRQKLQIFKISLMTDDLVLYQHNSDSPEGTVHSSVKDNLTQAFQTTLVKNRRVRNWDKEFGVLIFLNSNS